MTEKPVNKKEKKLLIPRFIIVDLQDNEVKIQLTWWLGTPKLTKKLKVKFNEAYKECGQDLTKVVNKFIHILNSSDEPTKNGQAK